MIFFSDAVFAIAITLLVLEIKVPHIEGNESVTLLNKLLNMTPKSDSLSVFLLSVNTGLYTISCLDSLITIIVSFLWLNLFSF